MSSAQPVVLSNPQITFALPQTTSGWLAVLVPSLLFAALAPGGFLSIPPARMGPNKGEIFTFETANWTMILTHTLVFALILWLLRALFPALRG
jgi:hypothetical protein